MLSYGNILREEARAIINIYERLEEGWQYAVGAGFYDNVYI